MVWLSLVAGFIVLIIGADIMVRGAARLAANIGVPPLVIGLTIVAFGTSAPEAAIGVGSVLSGQPELAVANVVGSNIFNILFVFGLIALMSPIVISRQLLRQDMPVMLVVTVVAVLMALNGVIGWLESVLLFSGLLAYTAFVFIQGRKQGAALADDDEVSELLQVQAPAWKNILYVVAGLLLLVVGAEWLVDSAVKIAASLGVSEVVIGLTIIAVGTSLPEVMTSIVATLRGQQDIAIGNIVGSNIFNILCVLGLSGLVSLEPLVVGSQLLALDFPVMLAVAFLCVPLFLAGAAVTRFDGVVILAFYVIYVCYLVAQAVSSSMLPVLHTAFVYFMLPMTIVYLADLFRRAYVVRRQCKA